MKRRNFFKNIAGITGLAIAAPAILSTFAINAHAEESRRKSAAPGADSEMVNPNDPTAKAIEYIEDTKKSKKSKGNKCLNCQLYVAGADRKGKKVGTCAIFPKKLVLGDAYCNSWVKKA